MGKSKDIQKKKAEKNKGKDKKKGGGGGDKKGKKKWGVGAKKEEDKSEAKVYFKDEKEFNAFKKGCCTKKVITISGISAQYGISRSFARKALKQLHVEGVIKIHLPNAQNPIYVPTNFIEEKKKVVEKKKGGGSTKKDKKKKQKE